MTTQIIAPPWTLSPATPPQEVFDAAIQGWMQLTQAKDRPDKGSIQSMNAFASAGKTIHLEFDYLVWGGNGGIRFAIYLVDASAASAGAGGIGGVGLGYVKMSGAYIGIGFDETGSFLHMQANAMTEGSKDIAMWLDSSLTVRGSQARGYPTDKSINISKLLPLFTLANQNKARQETIATGGVLHVISHFTPNISQPGYTIDLSINGVLLLNKFDYPHAAPASMKVGVTASNGVNTSNNHEIGNSKAEVADLAPPPVDLFRSSVIFSAIQSTSGAFDGAILTDDDRVHSGWDGSGPWDQYPAEHLDYELYFGSSGPEVNAIGIFCRQDDTLQKEPTDTTTFTQHGAIDFYIFGQDEQHRNVVLASVTGNNLVKRIVTIPNGKYVQIGIEVTHAASLGASIVEIEGYKL